MTQLEDIKKIKLYSTSVTLDPVRRKDKTMLDELLFHFTKLIIPISKIITGLAFGLFFASLFEFLQLTKYFAPLTKYITNFAQMGISSQTSFSLAFVSPQAANATLSESYQAKQITKQELFFANVLNSMPASISHSVNIFFISVPVLAWAGVSYTFLIVLAAFLRTFITMFLARIFMPKRDNCPECVQAFVSKKVSLKEAFQHALVRLKRRLPKIIYFTIPIYVLIYFLQVQGYFELAEGFLATHVAWLGISPALMGVIAIYMSAELTSAITMAGSLLDNAVSSSSEIVFALLIGNFLSTPMRAIRHQLPTYFGYFEPRLATLLVITNQGSRAISILLMALSYKFLFA